MWYNISGESQTEDVFHISTAKSGPPEEMGALRRAAFCYGGLTVPCYACQATCSRSGRPVSYTHLDVYKRQVKGRVKYTIARGEVIYQDGV